MQGLCRPFGTRRRMQSVNSGLKPGATLYRASGTSMARYGTAFVTAMIPSRHGFPEPLFQISRFDYHLVLPTCDIISDVTERERSQHSERTTNGPEHTDCSPPRLRQRSKVLKNAQGIAGAAKPTYSANGSFTGKTVRACGCLRASRGQVRCGKEGRCMRQGAPLYGFKGSHKNL